MLSKKQRAIYEANLRLEIENPRINAGEEDEFCLEGYIYCLPRTIGLAILVALTGGLFLVALVLRPSLRIRLGYRRCSLDQAQFLILQDKHGRQFIERVYLTPKDKSLCFRYFYHKKLKYIWKNEYKHFVKLRGLEGENCNVIYSQLEGATSSEASIKLDLYGRNSIEIELLPIWRLVLDEVLGPFYIYQFFICTIWLLQLYYQFAACILILSMLSVTTHVWQTRKQTLALRCKVQSASMVTVWRDNRPIETCSTELVPGDVLELPRHRPPFVMECDAVLISGSAVVDESMLTGESVPVPKVALVESPNSPYMSSAHKSNTFFSGTRILNVQTDGKKAVQAIVTRTGFSTAKGELARSILYPIESDNHLKRQLMKMSGIFFCIGIPCMLYTVYALGRYQFKTWDIVINVLDVATFLIPPVLPAILTSLQVHGQKRLRGKGIYCLNPRMISCSGEIDVMCFDKTGTLTEDSIDLAGVMPVSDRQFGSLVDEPKDNEDLAANLIQSMVTCNSLVEYCGNIEGDDLDIKLFTATGWKFANIEAKDDVTTKFSTNEPMPERIAFDPNNSDNAVGIYKQFPFESFLQRMLVIIREASSANYRTIIKGAPETIASFCDQSTVPKDFNTILDAYSRKGFRVLATASKSIGDNLGECLNLARSELECNMTFDGLLLFKNKLKPTTTEVLSTLAKANIRCIMATGDNLLTAISVAEECHMVSNSDAIIKVRAHLDKSETLKVAYSYAKLPNVTEVTNNNMIDESLETISFPYHLAIDGDSYNLIRAHNSLLMERLLAKGTIFARMSPDQKLSLIHGLQQQDHRVGMCGDGANDCGALRAANSGISLSVAEASVASPFTYKNKDIACVPELIKEGRCTLVAIFGAFKYQVCYCFILLGAVLILFWNGTKAGDTTYVFVDIILNILPPILFGTTAPYKQLVSIRPIRNMLSVVHQISMYSFIIFQVSIYYVTWKMLVQQPWYTPVDINYEDIDDPKTSHLAYGIFSVNVVSYVIAAVIFAPGPPYRDTFFSNKKYLVIVLLNFLMTTVVTLWAPDYLLEHFKFKPMPTEFRFRLFIISMANFIFCFLWQKCFLEGVVERRLLPALKRRFNYRSDKKYHKIHQLIERDRWPFDQMASGSGEGGSGHAIEDETLCSDNSSAGRNTLKVSISMSTFKEHQTSSIAERFHSEEYLN